ncbi:MAG: trigger factor [Clostridia bacterium]|nr:trigger factor [Clostridia bacterium]
MMLKGTNKVETNRYELTISVDEQTFADACSKAYKKVGKKIAIPGFRKGKAPRTIIEKYYGAEVFYEDALEILYPDAVQSALDESGLEMVSDKVDFDLVSMDKSGVEFKITITVKPEVTVKDYKGLKAEKVKTVVTDEEIDNQIKAVAERNARMITVEDRASAMDDTVVFDFEGFIDDKAFDGGKAEGFSLKLGSGQFIPGFEEQMVGKNAGEEFDVKVTFPEEYHSAECAGKEAVFKIKLHEIKVTELPEIDDEFVKDISEFDTLDEYKADLKQKATEYKDRAANDYVENQLIDKMLEGFEAEIPDEMVEHRVDENIRDFAYRLEMQGMNLETYLKYAGGDIAAFRDTFKEQSLRQVKVRLALEKIAELEGIKAEEADIDAEYARYATQYQMDVEQIKKAVPVTEISKDIVVQKAIDFVRENAVISEVDAPSEKPAAKKPAAKKNATKKTAAKTETEGEEKPAAKKPAAKKTATKKTAAKTETDGEKKPAAKKPAAKKTAAKKTEE